MDSRTRYAPWSQHARTALMPLLLGLSACGAGPGPTPPAEVTGRPYGGQAAAVPGIIQAENFDDGGEGEAFHDNDPANESGGAYRVTPVEIEPSTDGSDGFAVAVAPGEWLRYTVRVQTAGTYTLTYRLSSTQVGTLEFGSGQTPGPALQVSSAGGGWLDQSVSKVTLKAGLQTLKVSNASATGQAPLRLGQFELSLAQDEAAPIALNPERANGTVAEDLLLTANPDRTAKVNWSVVPSVAELNSQGGTLRLRSNLAGTYSVTASSPENPDVKQTAVVRLALPASQVNEQHLVGQWSAVKPWPVVGIHAVLLPTGKVMTWGMGDGPVDPLFNSKSNTQDIWDPVTDSHSPKRNTTTQLFCSGHSLDANGNLLVAGGVYGGPSRGIRDASVFGLNTQSWLRVPDMAYARWYPSTLPLPNGEVLTLGGQDENLQYVPTHEIWNPERGWRSLSGAQQPVADYAWLSVASDGSVFHAGPLDRLQSLDTKGEGSWRKLGARDGINRDYGTFVTYGPDKILVAGGGWVPTDTAVTIDVKTNTVRDTGRMSVPRRQLNATVLPDGKVFVSGGTDALPGSNGYLDDEKRPLFTNEIWDPQTGLFAPAAEAKVFRGYHSTALLLPDGRILSAGGGQCGSCSQSNYNAELFSPPYLFKADGSGAPADRPVITTAPSSIGYDQRFNVSVSGSPISRATLVRLGSVTHSVNFDQRFLELSLTGGSGTVQLQSPANANLAPPGFYMLFVLDANGVPSVAKILQLK